MVLEWTVVAVAIVMLGMISAMAVRHRRHLEQLVARIEQIRPLVTVQAPSPVVVPAPTVTVTPERAPRPVRTEIELVSGSGRVIGRHVLTTRRTPTLSVGGQLFVASHLREGGTWVYRRVMVERTH